MEDRRILCVGLSIIDMFSICEEYPEEDSDQSILDHYWQRGGNASNTCTVLSLLGSKCELLATIAKSSEYSFLSKDLEAHDIIFNNCVIHENCCTPVATVIINAKNGTRTMLFSNKNLPDLSFEDFKRIDFENSRHYKWVHFEVGPVKRHIKQMLEHLQEYNKQRSDDDKIKISVELEMPEQIDFSDFIELVDVLFISKDFAKYLGYHDMVSAVEGFKQKCRNETSVICAWGEIGAAAIGPDGNVLKSPAFSPAEIVDTLGAGDTFNAAVLHSLADNHSGLKEAITFGCKVAGAKVGNRGYKDLHKFKNFRND